MTEGDMILILVVCVSATSAMITFLFIWYFWLRHLLQRLYSLQNSLWELQQIVLRNTKHTPTMHPIQPIHPRNPFRSQSAPPSAHTIEIDPNLPPEEKERLIRYLKAEGFIQ